MVTDTKHFQIAIDGPVAAGKSTVAKQLAETLGFLYVDTGAMYRAVALKAKQECVQWAEEEAVVELMSTLNLELDKPNGKEREDGRLVTVVLDGKDVSAVIRNDLVAEGASIVSSYAGVREVLVEMQRNIAAGEDVVMEGRDIGTRVLPKAELKIYMDADAKTRARRKWRWLSKMGDEVELSEVEENMNKRDRREMSRKIDPLRPAEGAWQLDTTDMEIDEVVEKIVERVANLRVK